MSKNVLEQFFEKLFAFPLWVKQIIYMRLHDNLAESLSDDFIITNKNDIFHLYVPDISYMGTTELEERKMGFDDNFYNFLDSVSKGMNMIEISMNNYWTLEEVAKYFVLALEQNYMKTPTSQIVMAMAGFMSGKYRTAEYFKYSGKITPDQLHDVVNKQEEYIAAGKQIKMAELMISIGLITEKDCRSLLVLKEEAKQRFILDSSMIPDLAVPNQAMSSEKEEEYKLQISKLQEQNKTLIEQQKKLLAYFKNAQAKNGKV